MQKSAIARFCRTFSSLYTAGVPMLQSLSIVSKVVNNAVITECLQASESRLRSGQSIAGPMREHWVFPPMVYYMVSVGERTGSLDELMAKIADFYEEDVETMSERLRSMLEPFMIVFIAAIVGVIVLAILTPTFSLYNNI